jgi:hypothetical protein
LIGGAAIKDTMLINLQWSLFIGDFMIIGYADRFLNIYTDDKGILYKVDEYWNTI